jgi:hypothetical protein
MTIKDAPDVATALQILKTQFLPKTNVVISRNRHMSRTQREGEDLATYLSEINLLGAECKYEDILGGQRLLESNRDVFINGLANVHVKTRLLERGVLSLDEAVEMAFTITQAMKDAGQSQHSAASVASTCASTYADSPTRP